MSVAEDIVRRMIMDAVSKCASTNGGYITRAELEDLRLADGTHRRVIDTTRGIWNPKDMEATISIINDPNGRYRDRPAAGGLFHYAYEGDAGSGRSNTKLREAMRLGVPIVFLQKIDAGMYAPMFPVYVIDDLPDSREFLLALDESVRFLSKDLPDDSPQRSYAERVVQQRLHQAEFRGRVMHAYRTRCGVCRLAHGELLDAAHITEDRDEDGLPVVTNGLSLCKIHHAAFDRDFLGISPDCVIHINKDLLLEEDGPMLRHGLQEMNLSQFTVPERVRDRPDRDRLSARFDRFLAAG